MIEYPHQLTIPQYYAKYKIAEFLYEDISDIDKTSSGIIDKDSVSSAVIEAQENLIFAGAQVLPYFFDKVNRFIMIARDGQRVYANEIIAEILGRSMHILAVERTMLNLIQRLCGISTLTNQYVEIAKPFGVKILDTRKTTPGLRLFEKYAVSVGGGYNHRLDLSSGILLKDNHIKAAGGIENAIGKIKRQKYSLPVEIEVEDEKQIETCLKLGVDGLLLDNMTPENLTDIVNYIRSHPDGKYIFLEASGGINLTNLHEYVKTGVDAISIGALTHSVKSSNIHLEFL